MTTCETSLRVTNSSAERSQRARPSRVAKGFFSLSRKRDDLPAAGRMTANWGMGEASAKWASGTSDGARLSYARAAQPASFRRAASAAPNHSRSASSPPPRSASAAATGGSARAAHPARPRTRSSKRARPSRNGAPGGGGVCWLGLGARGGGGEGGGQGRLDALQHGAALGGAPRARVGWRLHDSGLVGFGERGASAA